MAWNRAAYGRGPVQRSPSASGRWVQWCVSAESGQSSRWGRGARLAKAREGGAPTGMHRRSNAASLCPPAAE